MQALQTGSCRGEQALLHEQIKRIPAMLGDAKPSVCHMVHRQIDGAFTCPQKVQHHRVLDREIVQSRSVVLKVLCHPCQASCEDVLFQDKSNKRSNLITHHFIIGSDAGDIATGIVLRPELFGEAVCKVLEHFKPPVSINACLQQVAEIVNLL